jgi:hypothetical protein
MSQPWTYSAPDVRAFQRHDEHYVEPEWVSERLFQVEDFEGRIWDPACGFGRIVIAARKHGYDAYGSDIADRGWNNSQQDFFWYTSKHDNIVTNPPFKIARDFAKHALNRSSHKAAMIFPTARLNAARWLQGTPLRRIWLLTPRPSMPPGTHIAAGGRVGGGKSDYCWLVWEHGYRGAPEVKWLRRDREIKDDRQDDSQG